MESTFDELCEGAMGNLARGALAAGMIAATTPLEGSPSTQTVSTASLPRGLRNNNPGNIEKGDNWEGMTGNDGRFIQFKKMEWGVRAFATILKNYKLKYNIDTLEGAISRWAPPVENDTERYINLVSKWSGIPRSDKIDLADPQTAQKLIKAMTRMENGQTIEDETIRRGLTLVGKKYRGR